MQVNAKGKRQRAKLRSRDVVGMDVLIGGWGFGKVGQEREGEEVKREKVKGKREKAADGFAAAGICDVALLRFLDW